MTQKNTPAAVVVVYNVHCTDSKTCCALAGMKRNEIPVLIYDNSTKDFGNRNYCEEQGWIYLGGNGNVGLSKAYNACINYLKDTKMAATVCLFDDDTSIDASYFDLLQDAMIGSACKIFVPFIYSNHKLISPCKLYPGHRIRLFENETEAISDSGEYISAINSCMALDLSLFDDYCYDENIFLDGIDHYFLARMKERGERIGMFPYRCKHDFSGDTKQPMKSALTRFTIFAKDFRYILRDQPVTYCRLVGKRALKLTLQHKTLAFLRRMLNLQ